MVNCIVCIKRCHMVQLLFVKGDFNDNLSGTDELCKPVCVSAIFVHIICINCKFVAARHSSQPPIPVQPTTLVNVHHGSLLH